MLVTAAIRRGIVAAGRFVWSLAVDDNPEVLLLAGVIVGGAYALHHERVAAVVALPLVAVGGLALIVRRAGR